MEYHKTKDILHVMQMLGHKNIMNTLKYTQLIDFKGDDYTQTSNGTHQIFEINYVHSTHTIEITGAETIPEFSTVFLVSLFLVSSLAAVAVYRKRLVL